jgi:dihydroorotate dehydrogenase
LTLIAAGGVSDAKTAYAKIRAGATLVQLYSAMVYEGPDLAARIARALPASLAADGFARVADAVGADCR